MAYELLTPVKDWLQSLSAVSKIPESILSDMHYHKYGHPEVLFWHRLTRVVSEKGP